MGCNTKAIRAKREPSCFKIGSFVAASGLKSSAFLACSIGAFAGKGKIP
jgi:hypothetical protein